MSAYNFFVCGPKFNFFRPMWERLLLIKRVSDFPIVDQFWRYLWLKSKVVKNAPNFERFLPSQILLGRATQKLYPCGTSRRVVKFREVTPTIPKVIGDHTLILSLILNVHP